MELALNSAEGPEAQWRAGFRSRIRKALDFLRGQNAFGKTQCRHFNAFNQTYLNNPSFRREVGKLSPFEMEVLCISSTLSQLEADSGHFTANEVTQALAFNIQDHRRGEVRDKILSDGHNNLPRLYQGATRERTIPDEDARINDIQRRINASLNSHAVQKLAGILSREHAIVPSHPPPVQTIGSRAKPPPPNGPPSTKMDLLSMSLRLNEMQESVCQQPHLCDEALVLGVEFLDQVLTVKDLDQALKQPRPRKSMTGFLRFVFESGPPLDQLGLDRKLKLRKMDPTSLLLCSAAYTSKMILNFTEGRFRALLSTCCKFLGDPGNFAASLPVELVDTGVAPRIVPEDHEAYSAFLRVLEEHRQARKAATPSLSLRVMTRAERPSRFNTSMTWPQEHVATILQRPLNTSSSVLISQLAQLYKETGRDIPFLDDVTEALVIASKSVPLNDRMQILAIAADMLTESAPASARATIVHQRSVALRLLGNSHQAEREILYFFEKTPDIPELLLKSLQLSLAESRIYQFRHHEAHEVARSIQVVGDMSEDNFQLLWDHIYCVGRIMRGRGDFESARVCFERCCEITHGIRPSKGILSQCALADIYCELDHRSGDPQHFYLLQAEAILEPAVKLVGETNSTSRRRLLLSLSEVYLRQLRVHEATTVLKGLITLFDGIRHPDIIDRLGHVRLYMTLARAGPSGQSVIYWREALRLNKAYNPYEEEVFTCAVIYLNLSWLSYCEGQSDQGQKTYAQASKVLQRKRPEYLLPGIGTYVYDDTLCKLQSKTL